MKIYHYFPESRGCAGWLLPLALLCGLLTAPATLRALERTQVFELEAGWNAVFLSVEPTDDRLEAVFGGTIVDVVARYFVPTTPVRYIESPEEAPWKTAGWSVWYSPRRAETFLSNLHAVHGQAAYLLHAVKAGRLEVKGETKQPAREWMVDSYNLAGFPVEVSGLTFGQYFAGSENRVGSKVYRMRKGNWEKVTHLAATPIRPGEACWVYCDGNTNYPGPLEVSAGALTGLNLNDRTTTVVIELRNRSNAPFSITAGIEANEGLPLFRQEIDLSELTAESRLLTPAATLIGSLGAGEVLHFRLELRRELLSAGAGTASRSAVLKFTTSTGVVSRVPVSYKPD